MKDRSIYNIRAIERAIQILSCFTDNMPEMTIAEIASAVRLPRPTVLRILATLTGGGYVERIADTDKYRLGSHLISLGMRVVNRLHVRRAAVPYMVALEEQFEETCDLSVFVQDSLLCIDVVQSRRTLRIAAGPGYRSPLHCTASGKAFLANLPADRLAQFLAHPLTRYTSTTITSPEHLMAELEQVRVQGYAYDNEEFNEGIRAVAAPIQNGAGNVIAVLGMPGPVERMTPQRMAEIARALVEAANAIASRLGVASHTVK